MHNIRKQNTSLSVQILTRTEN